MTKGQSHIFLSSVCTLARFLSRHILSTLSNCKALGDNRFLKGLTLDSHPPVQTAQAASNRSLFKV